MAERPLLEVTIEFRRPDGATGSSQGEWETHWIPWWRERSFIKRGYTINQDVEAGLGAAIERLLGIRETIACKFHPVVSTIAPSLDAVPDSLDQPLIGYLSKTGYRILSEHPDWSSMLYRDSADLNPKGGIVEVEIRVVRVVEQEAR